MSLHKQVSGTATPSGKGTFTAIISDPAPDCVGDRVTGWKWDGKDIPLLVGHDPSQPPVGRARPYVSGGKLMAEITLAPEGASAAADGARALLSSGTATAFSIGFKTPASGPDAGKANDFGGMDFPLAIVHEVSLVGVGCCASCQTTGAKCGAGTLTREDVVQMTREHIREVAGDAVRAAFAPPKRYHVTKEAVVAATKELVAQEMRKALNHAMGSVDDGPPRRRIITMAEHGAGPFGDPRAVR